MSPSGTCPFCGNDHVCAGKVIGRDGFGFKPDGTKGGFVLTLRDPFAFAFGPGACYCADCGMVWSKADAKDAAKFVRKFATAELKARLAAPDANAPKSPPPRRARPPATQ